MLLVGGQDRVVERQDPVARVQGRDDLLQLRPPGDDAVVGGQRADGYQLRDRAGRPTGLAHLPQAHAGSVGEQRQPAGRGLGELLLQRLRAVASGLVHRGRDVDQRQVAGAEAEFLPDLQAGGRLAGARRARQLERLGSPGRPTAASRPAPRRRAGIRNTGSAASRSWSGGSCRTPWLPAAARLSRSSARTGSRVPGFRAPRWRRSGSARPAAPCGLALS